MPLYNLIEYRHNYSKISGSCKAIQLYCKDIPVVDNNGNITNFDEGNLTASFNFKEKITEETGSNRTKEVELMVPLKYFSNFCGTLEMPLINYEINLILTCSANRVIVSTNNANQGATFSITQTKLYVPVVVTLSTQDNAKLLQQLKSGFKRTVNWNKYTSKPELLRQNA